MSDASTDIPGFAIPPPPAADGPEHWGVRPDHLAWIEDFRRTHGRAPRVLGIGNISNNGFRNSLALRAVGVESDVLCANYFHIMGCPEWECAYFDAAEIDDGQPGFSKLDLGDYERPRWFAQGVFDTAVDYLISYREETVHREALWAAMIREREEGPAAPLHNPIYKTDLPEAEALAVAKMAALEFAMRFPNRRDALSVEEVVNNAGHVIRDLPRLRRLLAHYDFIVGYSTDGMLPLLAGRAYVTYEHGTIRKIPFQRDFQGRMCALSYAMARDVLITNSDNIRAAHRLNLQSFRFTPHANLEDWRDREGVDAYRQQLFKRYDADFIVFHPSRQHWTAARDPGYEKGNDILIEAFARFVKTSRPKAVLMMVAWGNSVAQSKALIEALDIADRVVWLRPTAIRAMIEYIAASDVLADQFTIGTWGGVMPLGLMLRVPVLIHLDEDVHRWNFPKMPPVMNGNSVDSVFEALVALQDPAAAKAVGQAGSDWYDAYHSMSVVAGRFIDSFMASEPVDEFAAVQPAPAERLLGRQIIDQTAQVIVATAPAAALLEGGPQVVMMAAAGSAPRREDFGDVRRLYGPSDVFCYQYWLNAGASVIMTEAGAVIETPAIAYHYGAGVRLSYADVDPDEEYAWVRIRLAGVRGQIGVALYHSGRDKIVTETFVDRAPGVQEVVLKVSDWEADLLLFRTGDMDRRAGAAFLSAEVVAAAI